MIWLIKSVVTGVIMCVIFVFGLLLLARMKPELLQNVGRKSADFQDVVSNLVADQHAEKAAEGENGDGREEFSLGKDAVSTAVSTSSSSAPSRVTLNTRELLWQRQWDEEMNRLQRLHMNLRAESRTDK